MVDHLTKQMRSWNMSRIRSKNTNPEIIVRSFLHRLGYRFRLHQKNLPGKPDIVLAKYKTIIFVHGCFWHRHKGCKYCTTPSVRQDYWLVKFDRNVKKYRNDRYQLKKLGWKVITIWECDTKNLGKISKKLQSLHISCASNLS